MKQSRFMLFTIILFFFSCKKMEENKNGVQMESLKGLWMLESASRNGLETNTLQGLFYEINDSTIISNITGDTSTAEYVIEEGKMMHMIEDTLQYDISMLNDSFLEINSEIRSMPFQFRFKRVFESLSDNQDTIESDSFTEQDTLQ